MTTTPTPPSTILDRARRALDERRWVDAIDLLADVEAEGRIEPADLDAFGE